DADRPPLVSYGEQSSDHPLQVASTTMIPEHLIFLDLETTGINPARERITEVGLCEVQESSLLKPFAMGDRTIVLHRIRAAVCLRQQQA
ncbi:MAG: hypothetical protein P8Y96_13720, partial [Desulfuromonadales bacterium]